MPEDSAEKAGFVNYWKLNENPFENNEDPKYFYKTCDTERLFESFFSEMLDKKRIVLFMGENGSGKTYLTSMFMNSAAGAGFEAIFVPPGLYSGSKLLRKIISQLNARKHLPEDLNALLLIFEKIVFPKSGQERKNILIILDDADKNTELHDFKMVFWKIIKVSVKENSRLGLILTGETNLKRKLERSFTVKPPHAHYYQNALDEKETGEYIKYRLNSAGGSPGKIFLPDIFKSVYNYSKGLPLVINEICQLCLLVGEKNEAEFIDNSIFAEAVQQHKRYKISKPGKPFPFLTGAEDTSPELEEKDLHKAVYNEALHHAENLFKLSGQKIYLLDLRGTKDIINRLIGQVEENPAKIISLTRKNINEKNYLPSHCVNVCLLSTKLGISLGYSDKNLFKLALSAFLHDIGMIDMIDVIQKPEKLTEEDILNMKVHPRKGSEIMKRIKEFYSDDEISTEAIEHHHERIDGTGYPTGTKGNESINEYARIIGLVDVYEALTHSRPHRKELSQFEAVSAIMEMDGFKFDEAFISSLINEIKYYLPGMKVVLSTGETAKVLEINSNFPSMPKIEIIKDASGNEIAGKAINLMDSPSIKIIKLLYERNV